MWRVPIGPVPLAITAALLVAFWIFGRRRWPAAPLVVLVVLACAAVSLLALGLFSDRHQGAYRPAHIENGRLVPGEMQ